MPIRLPTFTKSALLKAKQWRLHGENGHILASWICKFFGNQQQNNLQVKVDLIGKMPEKSWNDRLSLEYRIVDASDGNDYDFLYHSDPTRLKKCFRVVYVHWPQLLAARIFLKISSTARGAKIQQKKSTTIKNNKKSTKILNYSLSL